MLRVVFEPHGKQCYVQFLAFELYLWYGVAQSFTVTFHHHSSGFGIIYFFLLLAMW